MVCVCWTCDCDALECVFASGVFQDIIIQLEIIEGPSAEAGFIGAQAVLQSNSPTWDACASTAANTLTAFEQNILLTRCDRPVAVDPQGTSAEGWKHQISQAFKC